MTEAQKIMEDITKVAEAATKPNEPKARYLLCKACQRVNYWSVSEPVPSVCFGCKAETEWIMGASLAECQEKLKAMMPEPPKAPETPEPPKRAAKPKAAKSPEPAKLTSDLPAAPPDLKERRLAAIQVLTKTRGLNHVEYREVGSARVYAVGFTTWNDGKPSYTMWEDGVDNEVSFRRLLDEARKQFGGTVCVDVVQLTDIEPDDLLACLFMGQLFASKMTPRGPIKTPAGAKVRVGAKLSKSGGLIFQVLGLG